MATETQTCAIRYPRPSCGENPTLAHFRHFSSPYTNEYRVSRIQPRLIGISQSSTSRIQYPASSIEYPAPTYRDFAKLNIENLESSIEYPESSIESFMQNKPNLLNAQINVTSVTIKNYEENRPPNPRKNKPNSNPIKPNWLEAQNERK